MRVSPLISLLLSLTPLAHAQFDFDQEVAAFFDFGKIPREFSGFSTSGPSSAETPATTSSSVFTAFSTDKLPDDYQNHIEEEEVEDISAKVSQSQAVTDSFLPEFGEIKENIQKALSSEGTNSSKESNVKRRSYGLSQGERGYGGGGGGGYGSHFGGGGYQDSGHGGGGGGGGYEDDHKGGLVQYGGISSGHKVHPKPPGPFGPAKPNYKCEKTKETLFVTKVDFTSDVKCFTVFSLKCEQSYSTGKVSCSSVNNKICYSYISVLIMY